MRMSTFAAMVFDSLLAGEPAPVDGIGRRGDAAATAPDGGRPVPASRRDDTAAGRPPREPRGEA